MGLDVSHDCWSGAYSAFTRWRNALAVAAGYELEDVGAGLHLPVVLNDASRFHGDVVEGDWTADPDDPLLVLLAHSDCDGHILPHHAGPLADRLEELMPLLPEDGGGHIGLYADKTQQFITGLRRAAARKQIVRFD